MLPTANRVLLCLGLTIALSELSYGIVCSPPWTFSHKNSCYHYGWEKLTWSEARVACSAIGGYLANIDNADEQNFTLTYMDKHNLDNHNWLGGTDFGTEGTWYWDHTGQKITYSNWGKREPNGIYHANCLAQYTRIWTDEECTNYFYYLCERN